MKKYYEYMNEISKDELFDGLLGYGMFSEKLPPIFSSEQFCNYFKSSVIHNNTQRTRYVYFESMRNTNIPRAFGIPTPINYAKLCVELKDNWDKIQDLFYKNTVNDEYKVSRIHIRKRINTPALFAPSYEDEFDYDEAKDIDDDQINDSPESQDSLSVCENCRSLFSMNYKNWKEDGDPLMYFSLGMKYVVKTDISQCFPSAYSHALSWALVGKEQAKANQRNQNIWYNIIDKACRNIKDGETNGFLIGPHASNVLSEIILTTVDKGLKEKYHFIRSIDDYTCYVEDHEKAERFLVDLNLALKEYGFTLNYKKTSIQELPQAVAGEWNQILKDKYALRDNKIKYPLARAYLDTAILAMNNNGNNASSLFFAIKVLGNPRNNLSEEAKKYCVKRMCDLAIIYPYLVPNMDTYVFSAFGATVDDIKAFTIKLYDDSLIRRNFEGACYSLYFAMKYGFDVQVNANYILNSSDCLSKLFLWLYSKKRNLTNIENLLIEEAKKLSEIEMFDDNWIFIYEALPESELSGEWRSMKQAGVTFIVDPSCAPSNSNNVGNYNSLISSIGNFEATPPSAQIR